MHFSHTYLTLKYGHNCLLHRTHGRFPLPFKWSPSHVTWFILDSPTSTRCTHISNLSFRVLHLAHCALCILNFQFPKDTNSLAFVLLVYAISYLCKIPMAPTPHQVYFCVSFRDWLKYQSAEDKNKCSEILCGCLYE